MYSSSDQLFHRPDSSHCEADTQNPENYYQGVEFFDAEAANCKKLRRSKFIWLNRLSFLKLFLSLSIFLIVILSLAYISSNNLPEGSTSQKPLGFQSNRNTAIFREGTSENCPGHLIVVPGHAIYIGHLLNATYGGHNIYTLDSTEEVFLKDGWLLQHSFQLDQTPFFIRHIHRGIELMQQDSDSVLMFSGGMYK